MPPKSLRKVQKQIAKKKGGAPALHQNSRDFKRLQRAKAREEKLRLSIFRAKSNRESLTGVRLDWFCSEAENFLRDHPGQAISDEILHELIQEYLQKNRDAAEEANQARRPGRPASAQQDQIEAVRDKEEKEYQSGFWLPDLQDADTIEAITNRKGFINTESFRNHLKYCRISKEGHKRASTYPPNHDV